MGIKVWEAERYIRVLAEGRTKPLLIECSPLYLRGTEDRAATGPVLVSASGKPLSLKADSAKLGSDGSSELTSDAESPKPEQFVVKSLGNPEVYPDALLFELLGNLLARAFGINTPEPVLIHFSDAFVKLTKNVIPGYVSLQPSWGVGCQFLAGGLAPISPSLTLSGSLVRQAANIYAFDHLVANPDRGFARPNCALVGAVQGEGERQLIAFDFEKCFSFIQALFNPKPWMFSELRLAPGHVFHAPLKKCSATEMKNLWRSFMEDLASVQTEELWECVRQCPDEWTGKAERIIEHIAAVKLNADKAQLELAKCLACPL